MTATRFRSTAGRAGGQLLGWIDHWVAPAQERARRNAMVASTDLLHRRREREEVEEFLRVALRRAG
ncbi:hypothetical protein [Nocardioides massiliensis]|uniref:Uncharacterized protein n=1 Tax=Nocardioides massiliensis TaxID=1325935 RepID=A0ABT9NQ70_9ACTN|nr:hypothetical protein [Nocardioides massiliensis]MDP9822513.1 hypothetical protein [Nocardioides massiliensis]